MFSSSSSSMALVLLCASLYCHSVFGFLKVSPSPRTNHIGIADIRTESILWKTTRLYSQPSKKADDSDSDESKQVNRHEIPPPLRSDPKATNDDHSSSFSTGQQLEGLRADLASLRENLQWAEAIKDQELVNDLKKAIANGERLDPDLVYCKALRAIADTKASNDITDAQKAETIDMWQKAAQNARAVLPQFQLEGLWVGNYGAHGDELVNVTYIGDTLVASKVTGDANVPRGQISFTVDFAPKPDGPTLEPLKLSLDKATSPSKQVPRFAGQGQVAKPGFTESAFVDGQLVLFEKHFSFVWVPTRHHVLFRRPTLKQILSLMRDTLSREDELCNMRDHLDRCFQLDMNFQVPIEPADDVAWFQHDPFRRISLQQELESMAKEAKSESEAKGIRFSFWNMYKYIDSAFRDDGDGSKKGDQNGPDKFYEGEGI